MSLATSYTVVLTKGAHTVRATDAQAICEAIQAGEKLVKVGVELFPGSDVVHPTTLVTAHVIALAEIQDHTARASVSSADDSTNGKVHNLWDYRAL